MIYRVEFTAAARSQAVTAAVWWRANRPAAPELFERELTRALEELARSPLVAAAFGEVEGRLVRKALLPRARYALYFVVEGDLVTVHALWHGARGAGPPLF